jgi:pimeloyl-ACP methyl ester carboxylesterase
MTALLLLIAALAPEPGDSLRIPVAPAETLRVVATGTGAPVVLIPGLVGTAFGYRRLVDRLADGGWRAIVIEPLGTGGSSRPKRADYSLAAQADRVAAVLDTLGVVSAVVVAHAVSGSIVLRLAYRHPGRVRAVVAIEGGAAESATSRGFRRLMDFAPVLRYLVGSEIFESFIVREIKASSADTAWIDAEVVRGYTADALVDLGASLAAYRAISRAPEPERLADRLAEIGAPVVLLLGEAPHRSAPAAGEIALLRDRLRDLVIERVPGAGHFIHEERPEFVLAAVSRFRDIALAAPAAAR